jgi:hypothetical protein
MLCSFIQNQLRLNSQPHVHHGKPEKLKHNDRAIYLYGDPIDAVLSFYRRDKEYGTRFVERHYRNLDVSGKFPATFEEYLNWGHDAFGLEAHFDKYVGSVPTAGLIAVRFDDMWPHLEEIFEFLRLPASIADFPEKRARQSKREALDPGQIEVLEHYFSSLLRKQAEMPDVQYVSHGNFSGSSTHVI